MCVQITNLHIRYEDDVTRPGDPFAMGLTLHDISAHTVGQDGIEAFIHEAALKLLRKKAILSRFAIYFDTGARPSEVFIILTLWTHGFRGVIDTVMPAWRCLCLCL